MADSGGAGGRVWAAKKRIKRLGAHIINNGPIPPEGVISQICEMFHCTPNEALEQDPTVVFPIMEYRVAREAKHHHNNNIGDMQTNHVKLWREMTDG